MNSLSWFLYVADVSDSLRVLFLILAIISTIYCGLMLAIYPIAKDEIRHDNASQEFLDKLMRGFRFMFWPMLLSWVLFIAMPTKQTLYTIAASQVGEQIIQLEEIQNLGGEAAELARVSIEALRAQISSTIPQKE